MPDILLSAQLDPTQLARVNAELDGVQDRVQRVLSAAVNKTARGGATTLRRAIASEVGLPVGVLGSGDHGIIKPILSSNREENPTAAIRIANYNVALKQFKNVTLGPGMAAAYGKQGDMDRTENFPFINTGPYHPKAIAIGDNIFVRRGAARLMTKGRYAGTQTLRQPIFKLFGPSPRKAFEAAPAIAERVLSELGDELEKNVLSQIDRILERRRIDRPD